MKKLIKRTTTPLLIVVLLCGLCLSVGPAYAADKPNIVVIWGDDIGQSNISAYTHGLMGYQTPNIDRMAAEGMMFTDSIADQSCTAGRSSFTTGQSVFRNGLSKVGTPGAKEGISPEDPTIATLMKQLGYVTDQFGKNHLGDRNEHLPTAHGYDEFYGSLYHLNASEEPELRDYPKGDFLKNYGPRGVLDCKASDKDDPTENPRFGKIGKQIIKDTGPLTKKRMETVDDEIHDKAVDFIKRQHKAGKIKAGSISNEIMSHLDWIPTLVAAAGEPQVKEKLLKGYEANGNSFKVHLDGYNFLPYLTGKEEKGSRTEFFYFSDGGDMMALRYNNWKVHFMVQDSPGTMDIWQREFRGTRMPYIFNLRTDPYEFATVTSNTYWERIGP